jgi:hypothetical protein
MTRTWMVAVYLVLCGWPAWAQGVSDVQRVIDANPSAFACAHTGRNCTDDFIQILAADLHYRFPAIGLNGKRGNYSDISDDALAIFVDGSGDCIDTKTGRAIVVMDVIAGAGSSSARAAWQRVGCGAGNPGAWVQPRMGEVTLPSEPPPVLNVNLQPILDALAALKQQIDALTAGQAAVTAEMRASVTELLGEIDALAVRVDGVHRDVLIATDLGRQMLATEYTGRVLRFPVTLRPHR